MKIFLITPSTYRLMWLRKKFNGKSFLVLLALQLFCCAAFAQRTISGLVTDQEGKPLQGTSVSLKGTSMATATDAKGNYTISTPGESGVLVFSFIGFLKQEIAFTRNTAINVEMQADRTSLSGVVVVGYGTQSRDLVTTSISKLDSNVLKNIPYSNPAYALQGTLPGVRVTSRSGQPGAAPMVVLRGGTSLDPNTSYPLYIIDGVISPDLTGINSTDIESMQVLKDAASTAIYGARGSNGVIIITTKSGHKGRSVINYNYSLSFSKYKSVMEMLSARDFIYYNRLGLKAAAVKTPAFEGILSSASSAGTGNDLTNNTFYTTQYLTPENEHKLNEGWESMQDPIDPTKTIIFKGTDWRDVMFRTAVSHDHNISASGGTDKATYSLSLGYLNNSGVTIQTGYKRLSLNTKGDVKVRDNVKIFSRVMYISDESKGVSDESNIFGRMMQVAPTVKFAFEDGTLSQGPNGNKGNPLYRTNIINSSGTMVKSTFTVGGEWKILPNLTFTPQVSLLTRTIDSRSFTKSNMNGLSLDETRSASEGVRGYKQQGADAVFAYNKSFKNVHNLDVTAGYSYLKTEESRLSAAGRGAATDLIPTLNASAIPVGVSSSRDYFTYMGFFSRVNYNYKQKYLFSLNSRYDASSNLGNDYKWGFFPGISAGWNLHHEDFWQSIAPTISQLKLRGSYGVNGNVNGIGAYQAQGSYSGGALYGGRGGIVNTGLANAQLKWEQTKTLDLGLDLGLIDNRIGFTFDIFRKITDNLLSTRTLPQSTGFGGVLTNLGSVQNKGMELSLNLQVFPSSSAFQWNAAINGAIVKNKILKLPDNGALYNRIGGEYVWDPKTNDYAWLGGLQEGQTMGDVYGYKQIGLYQTDAEAAAGPYDVLQETVDKTKFGGDVKWFDADKNDTIDTRDRVYMGNYYPTWTGGLVNSFSYKGFSLTIRFDFAIGQTIYNYMRATTTGQFAGDLGLSSYAGQSWLKEGDQTNIPRLYYGDYQANLSRGSSLMYEKGDYLALRELSLSYELPARLLQQIKISNLRFNLSGHNLHYFTNYKGINPENGGTDNGSYPISADIIFGASVSF
ncbi:TonB-dependent receptor [Chitinophaga sp. MM2321]|uniref:SusC/RagA family TonB-linked outer membrane protein n=1 Tax=Chitinophaga sp. MM2321 TaxID=3137178 RepID=UPI0032D56A92